MAFHRRFDFPQICLSGATRPPGVWLAARAGLTEVHGIDWTTRFGRACADRERQGRAIALAETPRLS